MRRARSRFAVLLLVALVALALASSSCGGTADGEGGDGSGGGTGPSPDSEFSFLVCGDTHARTDLLQRIIEEAREGEFLVIAGDITTGKGLGEMQGMKDFLDASGIEYHVIPGDNDMPMGDVSAFRAVFGPDFYSLDRGHAHLVFLNDAVIGTGCPQEVLTWLQGDLDGVGEDRAIIAFAHVPPGAPVDMGRNGFVERESESNREMLSMLEAAGSPVLYCGHIHAYMLYSSGPPRVVVTGGAGANPHVSEQSGGYHHFLRVTVRGGEVTEEVIRL